MINHAEYFCRIVNVQISIFWKRNCQQTDPAQLGELNKIEMEKRKKFKHYKRKQQFGEKQYN